MDSVGFLRCVSVLLVVVNVSAEDVTVTEGENITLPCQAGGLMPVEVVEWSRPAPDSKYVLVFIKPNPELEIPEQQYKDRVELKDMLNGDVSLVLRNVTAEDRGTYECYVQSETNRRKRDIKPVNIIILRVTPAPPSPGNMDGSREDGEKEVGGNQYGSGVVPVTVACCIVVFLVMVAVTLFMVIRRQKREKLMSSPNDEAEKTEMI